MKTLKKTLALIAALAVVSTTFAACKKETGTEDDNKGGDTTTAATPDGGETTDVDDGNGGETTEPVVTPGAASAAKPDDSAVTLKTDGSTFTIVTWNANDFPALLNAYTGHWDGVTGDAEKATKTLDANKTTPTGKEINFVNLGVPSQQALQTYDNMLAGGEDIDVYAAEADFALNYTGDSKKSANLADLGFKTSDWDNAYSYTMEIGKNAAGEVRGVSWQACPGGYAYRTDLAEQYLGVKSPADMQAKVKDWATMEESAKTVFEASDKKTAMCATLGGIWQVFSSGRSNPWVKDGNLVTDDKALTDYIELAKKWTDAGYVTKATQWNDAWYQLGQDDSTMGYFVSTWGFGDAILLSAAGGEKGKTFGKWNVCEGPARFYWGGTWMVVNPATDNGIEAKDFIWALTVDNDTMKEYGIKKGEYVNNKAVIGDVASDPGVADAVTTQNLGGQRFYDVLSDVGASITLKASNITKYDAAVKSSFQTAVQNYVDGKTADVSATIEAFKDLVAKDVTGVNVD